MFFFDFGQLAGDPPLYLIGASPEMHVRLEGRTRHHPPDRRHPPARRRPPRRTLALEHELLADPKERAEHVMLVDLARNDLGRVCDYGSVHVPEQMVVERYSHVMHIVSQVEGSLRAGSDAFDLMRATFPAGTVSGAPKIRAMQIIDRAGRQPARAVCRRGGLLSPRTVAGYLHHHPHPAHARRHRHSPGRRPASWPIRTRQLNIRRP